MKLMGIASLNPSYALDKLIRAFDELDRPMQQVAPHERSDIGDSDNIGDSDKI